MRPHVRDGGALEGRQDGEGLLIGREVIDGCQRMADAVGAKKLQPAALIEIPAGHIKWLTGIYHRSPSTDVCSVETNTEFPPSAIAKPPDVGKHRGGA